MLAQHILFDTFFVPLKSFVMNYCMSDMYDMAHGMSGGYTVPSGGEYCM